MTIFKATSPQWENHNIEKYLTELLPELPAELPINATLQKLLYLMVRVEGRLWDLSKTDKVKFKQIFSPEIVTGIEKITDEGFFSCLMKFELSTQEAFLSQQRIYEADHHIFEKRGWNCLLIILYAHAAKLSIEAATISLAQEFCLSDCFAEMLCLPKNLNDASSVPRRDFCDADLNRKFSIIEYPLGNSKVFLPDFGWPPSVAIAENKLPPYQQNLIMESRNAIVFVMESVSAAHALQVNNQSEFLAKLFKEQKDYWNNLMARKNKSVAARNEKIAQQQQATHNTLRLLNQEANNLDIAINNFQHKHTQFCTLKAYQTRLQNVQKQISDIEWNLNMPARHQETCWKEDNEYADCIKQLNECFTKLEGKCGYNKEYFNFENSAVWSSFFGGIELIDRTDWTSLARRKVFYVHYGKTDEKDLIRKFLTVVSSLSAIEDLQLSCIHVPEIIDKLHPENNHIHFFSTDEVLQKAFDAGLTIPESMQKILADYLEKHGRVKKEKFLVDPIIGNKAMVLLTAKTNVGKSWVAQGIGYALATKGELFNDWIVTQKCKVLCICDDELDPETLEDRKKIFEKIYKHSDQSGNFILKTVFDFDLTEPESQEKVDKMLIDVQLNQGEQGMPVKLLILDHLTKLTRSGYLEKKWTDLSKWLQKLKRDNLLSILIVHHENKEGSTLGTSIIENDVDTHIHLERVDLADKNKIGMKITVPKNRRAKNQTIPHEVHLELGKHPRWIEFDFETLNWKGLSNEKKIEEIKKMRETMSMRAIAHKFGKALITIEKFASKHNLTNKRIKKMDSPESEIPPATTV